MKRLTIFVLTVLLFAAPATGQDGLIDAFPLEPSDIELTRLAQPTTYVDKVGHRFALLGVESGRFEAWAYPLKLLRDFQFSFFVGSSTNPIRADEIVHSIRYTPASATLRYVYQSFTVDATYVVPPDEPGALILLRVQADEPLTLVCGFLPVLQPMWPAGIGGQYARWDGNLNAYLISEPTRQNNGYVGSPAAEGLSYTPAHMLADTPNEFRISIDDPDAVQDRYVPIILAGGNQGRDATRAAYDRLAADPAGYYQKTVAYYRALREGALQVETPDDALNRALAWATVSYDNLFVDHPTLGRGMVAGLGTSGTGGRPGFGWFFGGDTFINSFSLNGLGLHDHARDALAFMHAFQRDDGKMAHEITQAVDYVDWFEDYPYAYLHGDTSPYFITAVYDYFRMTGDRAYLEDAWPIVQRAYAWSLSTDGDGDGLMDNAKAGLGALEFGALTDIQTDIYLGAVWTRATKAMAALAEAMGDTATARAAQATHEKAVAAFERFWDDDQQRYSYAFNADGQQVDELTPWPAVGLMWGFGRDDRAEATLQAMASATLATDWGIRMISDESPRFEPLNYNYGAVWPFLTSWVTTAHYKHHRPFAAFPLLKSTAALTFERGLGHVGEVFSGARHTWPQESVAHQGFCTAGVVLPIVRGLLGLEGSAPDRHLVAAPHLPPHWDAVTVRNYRLGDARFDLRYRREAERLVVDVTQRGGPPPRVTFAPALGIGTQIRTVRVNGEAVAFDLVEAGQTVQPQVTFALDGTATVEVAFTPTVEIVPPYQPSPIGAANEGIKIIDLTHDGDRLVLDVEGLAGRTYTLALVHADRLASVDGATRDGDRLRLTMPEGPPGTFVRHRVVLETP